MKGFVLLLAAGLLLAACNGNKTDDNNGNLARLENRGDVLHKLPVLHVVKDTTFAGHRYHCVIDRVSSDSLGTVEDELGGRFANTRLSIAVRRDGAEVFRRTFHKESFANLLDEDFLKQSILDGCMFHSVRDGKVIFSLAVSYPESDMSQPLILEVDANGGYSVSIDNSIDDDEQILGVEDDGV